MNPDPATVIAFDADVLIYSVFDGHPLGEPVIRLLELTDGRKRFLGSTLLVPELLIKPMRQDLPTEQQSVLNRLAHLELLPFDGKTAELSASLGAVYGLSAMDAAHLATAVNAGADSFITNNRKHFDRDRITELEIVYPDQLA